MYEVFGILLVLSVSWTGVQPSTQPEVAIDHGIIRGLYTKTLTGRQISSFIGIPYAKAPSGKHRFKEPVPALPWLGVYNATRKAPVCLQYSHETYKTKFSVHGSEDCLYVNVYTPKVPVAGEPQKPMDVIVFIHGGAFMFLSSDIFGPGILLDHDVVLVTFNYRLGPLGFLSTEDNIVPGNNGMKDQVLALKWVQNNIAAFGGNPRSVTISGLSAGGASVHYHLLSPLSKGLFSKAIIMSGSALNPWPQAENSKEKAMHIADRLGCPTNESFVMIRCLRNRPAEQIVGLTSDFLKYLYNPYSPFAPVVEPPSPNAFLSESPIKLISEGLTHDVPILASVTSEEGLYPGAEIVGVDKNLKELEEHFLEYLPHILDYNYTVPTEQRDSISQKIKEHYQINFHDAQGIHNIVKMLGDRLFNHGVSKALKLHAASNTSPVYMYLFSYKGKKTIATLFSEKEHGVSHADDQFFLLEFGEDHSNEEEKRLSDQMVQMWLSFAANGTLEQPWVPIHQNLPQFSYIEIMGPDNFKPSLSKDFGEEIFWDSLGLNENILEQATIRDEL